MARSGLQTPATKAEVICWSKDFSLEKNAPAARPIQGSSADAVRWERAPSKAIPNTFLLSVFFKPAVSRGCAAGCVIGDGDSRPYRNSTT